MPDITILTCRQYVAFTPASTYEQNILEERALLQKALEAKGLSVHTTSWDDPNYDWTQTKAIVFRTIWDYFERYQEFTVWLEMVKTKTQLINPLSLISWNIDKHYLADLRAKNIAIVPTAFIDTGAHRSIHDVCKERGWTDVIIKPAIAGGAFHTYKILEKDRVAKETLFKNDGFGYTTFCVFNCDKRRGFFNGF